MRIFVPTFYAVTAITLYFAITRHEGALQLGVFCAALPLAWMLADLLTGLTHWGLDTYGSVDTPFVGQTVIKPFRMHHDFPTYMVQFDSTDTVALAAMAVLPIQLGLLYLATLGGWASVTGGALAVAILGTVGTNLFHKWAHMEEPPATARLLQRMKLILPTPEHDRHHAYPHDCSYCITNGWMNPFLDKINFWRGLEGALRALGIQPQSELYHPQDGAE
jgi:ubiquitin-conjugating enzyme E2 variant